jgi:hypothetical protein
MKFEDLTPARTQSASYALGRPCEHPVLRQLAKTVMKPPLSVNSVDPHVDCSNGYPLTRTSRALLAVWSLLLLAGFGVAFWLEPDPRGFGTHQKLGLPPCLFQLLFGIPCPNCGMTTSFAYFIRGDLRQAAHANFAGLVLAIVCAAQIPWCWWSVYCSRLWKVNRPDVLVVSLVLTLAAVCVLQWVLRLFVVSSLS